MNNEIVRIENVYRSYGTKYEVTNSKNGIEVLKGINLSVKENEFIAIMGKSGCGNYGVRNWRISEGMRSGLSFRTFI